MKDFIERNRIVANTELEIAVRFTELSVRLARSDEAHEHDTRLLNLLQSQLESEHGRARHVRIGRGAQ